MSHAQHKPTSTYARYGKKPYRYSDAYQSWHREVVKTGSSDTDRARELDAEWREKFPLNPTTTNGDTHV